MNFMKNALIALSLIAFTTAAIAQSGSEKILVPIRITTPVPGANGSLWSSSLLVRNTSSTSFTLNNIAVDCNGLLCPPAVDLTPGATYQITPSGGSDRPAAVMTVLPGHGTDLSFTLRVQDISRQSQTWGTEVPVVRESDTRSGKIVLLDVPVTTAFRNTLRVYDIDGKANDQLTVRLFALDPTPPSAIGSGTVDRFLGESTIALRPPAAGDTGRSPSYAEIGDLSQIAPLGTTTRVAVEVEPVTAGLRIWSFVSVTNNDTQHVTVIVPN
jgi:hypothetical protein